MKIWRPDTEGEALDLTPMIDVVFLLIVFFMTVANMITAEKMQINMPVALHSVVPEEFGGRSTITVMRDGAIFAGTQPTDLDTLPGILAAQREADPKLKVYLRADSFTEHIYVNDVMQACAAAGISNVIFAAYQSE